MHKKFITGIVLALAIIFAFTACCFAENNNKGAIDSIRDAMGNVENAMSNTAQGVGNAAKDLGNGIKNTASDAGKAIENSANKAGSSIENGVNKMEDGMSKNNNNNNNNNNDNNNTDNNNNDDYTATRTSADNTMLGMNSTAWTWIILGIAGIGIIAIVWYYTSQVNSHNNHNDE